MRIARLTDQEKQEIIRFVEADKPLPDKHRLFLFDEKREEDQMGLRYSMKRGLAFLFALCKWIIILVVTLEVLSFLAITSSNIVIYGHAREGSRAKYDPYTFFQMAGGVRHTAHNRVSDNPQQNVTIWLFGGSTLRSSSASPDKTIPGFMAKMLNDEDATKYFRVINLGVNSFNSLMETKYLQKALIERPVKPDIVIFYDGANDAKYFAEHRTPAGHHGYRRARALVESYYRSWFGILKPLNAALYASFTKELYDKIHQIGIPLDRDSPEVKELSDVELKRYDYVNKVTRCYGAKFLLVWQPMLWTEDCPDEIPQSIKDLERGFFVNSDRYQVVRNNFAVPYFALKDKLKHKPYFMEITHVLCTRTSAAYRPDGVHLLDHGREIIARRLVDKVRDLLQETP
ncbi:SGNH/GDSL hydrolase family protein [Thermodesulfobacteriota bacterium]